MFLPRIESEWKRKLRGTITSKKKNVRIGLGCAIVNVDFSEGVTIENYIRLIGYPIIRIGKEVCINSYTMILGEITIGDNTLISQFVNIWGRAHRFEKKGQTHLGSIWHTRSYRPRL